MRSGRGGGTELQFEAVGVRASGTCMMPALLMRTSIGPCHDDAKARTDDRELRSSSRTSVSPAMPSATARPLAGVSHGQHDMGACAGQRVGSGFA